MGTKQCKKRRLEKLEKNIRDTSFDEQTIGKIEKLDFAKIRIGLLGDAEVGKTSIIKSLIEKEFDSECLPTIGIDKFEKKECLDGGKEIKLIVWDTSGQERFRSIALKALKHIDGIVLVFDVTNRQSFDNLDDWITIIRKNFLNPIVILCGNKTDIDKEEWKVGRREIERLAIHESWKYFEISAKNMDGIDDGFNYLVNKIYDSKIKNIIDN